MGYVAVLLPGFSDMILGLRGVAVGLYGWVLALLGPFGCVVLCEICKLITKMQKQEYQKQLERRQEAEARSGRVVHKASSHRSAAPTKVKSISKTAAPQHSPPAKPTKPDKSRSSTKGLCQCLKFC